MRLQKLQHESVRQGALIVEGVEQRVVPKAGPPLVHDLGLALRVKVLPDLAHNANHLALPRLQQGRVFLNEIQQVFFDDEPERKHAWHGVGVDCCDARELSRFREKRIKFVFSKSRHYESLR